MSEYLNNQDLHQLTGYARPVKQLGWLVANGIPHRADGSRIIVSHKHVQSWLEGRTVIRSVGPNWSAVK